MNYFKIEEDNFKKQLRKIKNEFNPFGIKGSGPSYMAPTPTTSPSTSPKQAPLMLAPSRGISAPIIMAPSQGPFFKMKLQMAYL
jgi:hypothetical protein